MLTRRTLLLAAAFAAAPRISQAHSRRKAEIAEKYQPRIVPFAGYPPGQIVVDAESRFLYLVEEPGSARRYGVGVGPAALSFRGTARIDRKAEWPRWRPTDNMIRRNPRRYARFAGGVEGGPGNPLGARALYLYRDGRDTYYRIHGTNNPSSIGRAVSAGCIRMFNEHVKDLYDRVPLGTIVLVL